MGVVLPLKCKLYIRDFPGPELGSHQREIAAQFWIDGHEENKLLLSGVLIANPGEAMVVQWLDRMKSSAMRLSRDRPCWICTITCARMT